MKFIDLTGQRFGRLVIEKRTCNDKRGRSKWVCNCDCGEAVVHWSTNLRNGRVTSCGCLKKEKCRNNTITHNMSRTKVYKAWSDMIQRCENKKNAAYVNYGGRGVSVCKQWRGSFESFYKDMGDPPFKLSLDRINNDGDYSLSNCRWATRSEQNSNRRRW